MRGWLDTALLGGMVVVFLVTALAALLQPGDFTRLAIGVNHLLLGLALGLSLGSMGG